MKDGEPVTDAYEQEMLDWVKESYQNKLAETIELFLRIKYPILKDIQVNCKGADLEINYTGDPYTKEEIIKAVDSFIKEVRT